ncbi:MAG: aminotransferase class I/II-fold pyridoxal phosphate-dependent enzyme [Reyranella sp.]|jgi:perosamine synthetase|nr:aminotransferase class I/II-fold pyridoxal phosphate-dependent enzyme [Reyranella sp.]MBL6650709.1 aminotransferase class I/II-fold pyridoxal phosphate-dependent enzyme [Reyranella sp.]
MSLAVPEETSLAEAFVCNKAESVLSIIEKCLDNGTGSCLVVGDDRRLIGRISLDDIRRALADGTAIVDPTLGWHPAANMISANLLPNDIDRHELLRPVVDSTGHLTGVLIDRSAQPVQVAMPTLTSDDFRSMLDAFISGWISSKGPYVQKFEADFSRFVGVKHGVAVSNGTVALHLALVALGIGPGDEVIVPDLTFAATINAVLYCGATPVIVDVDPVTWCMSRESVKRACTPQTKAIIPVHLYGRPAEIGPITEFARSRGIAVVEDCAEAHGARYRGKAVGQFGDVSCFSFYANKIVTTGEGGMCVTDSQELANSLRILRDHGMSPDRSYWHERVGYNYRITNLQAAIGQSQIWRVNEVLQRNARVAALYREALKNIPDVRFPPPLPDEYRPVVWMACVQVPAEKRLPLMRAAHEANIETRSFFHPLSALPPYGKYARSCPTSIELSATGVNLPTSRAVDEQVVERVARVFHRVLA